MLYKTGVYSEYQTIIRNRFENSDVDKDDYCFALHGPEQYETENEMLKYVQDNPTATISDICSYFDKITPNGLPPCASEWDDDEDDE